MKQTRVKDRHDVGGSRRSENAAQLRGYLDGNKRYSRKEKRQAKASLAGGLVGKGVERRKESSDDEVASCALREGWVPGTRWTISAPGWVTGRVHGMSHESGTIDYSVLASPF